MKRLAILFLIFLLFVVGCNNKLNDDYFTILNPPEIQDYKRGLLYELAEAKNKDSNMELDLLSYDLSDMDLSDQGEELKKASFDSDTVWSEELPKDFSPTHSMELGKNPGLNIWSLHKAGITGKNVAVAVIDQPILIEHAEFVGRIKMYEEINIDNSIASSHGCAVTSILGGDATGVAPGVDIYYIAAFPVDKLNGEIDLIYIAKAINRIIEVNARLDKKNKIRVISISLGWDKKYKGYDELKLALDKAKDNNIFVISTALYDEYGFNIWGLGRDCEKNPDDINSYRPGAFWEGRFINKMVSLNNVLMVPMDSRTTASPTGQNDYTYFRTGGLSWTVPYVAGLYALACQVDSQITPELFLKIAMETSETISLKYNDEDYDLRGIINPTNLLKEID